MGGRVVDTIIRHLVGRRVVEPHAVSGFMARPMGVRVEAGGRAVEQEGEQPLLHSGRTAEDACDEGTCETHVSNLPKRPARCCFRRQGLAPLEHSPSRLASSERPIPLSPRSCSGRGRLDPLGDHRAACATSGVFPLKRTAARVCHKGGVHVTRNVRVADVNIDVPLADDRLIAPWRGAQLATLVSPLTHVLTSSPGTALPRQAQAAFARRASGTAAGAALLPRSHRVGAETAAFLRLLARHRAVVVPAHLRPAARAASISRWTALLAVAAQRIFELPASPQTPHPA